MKTKVILTALVTIIGLSAFTEKSNKTSGTEETYTADADASSIAWLAKKVTGQHNGTVKVSKGEVKLNNGIVSGGNFEMDMTSIAVSDLEGEYNTKLVNHLKSDDFFSVEKHPKANFVITKAQKIKAAKEGGPNYKLTGKLTIKGITNEISFPAIVAIKDKTLTGKADFNINRTKWDIRYGSKSFFESIGDKAIDDEFNLKLKLIAKQK